MKRTLIATVVMILVLIASACGQGSVVGQWSAGGHIGYSLGLSGFGSGVDPTFGFGGFGLYQMKEKIAIGGEFYIQKISCEFAGFSASGDFSNILFLATYETNPGAEKSIIYLGGGGIYEDDFGVNAGAAYRKFINPTTALMGGGRVHIMFVGDTPMWLHLFFGVQFFFGTGK